MIYSKEKKHMAKWINFLNQLKDYINSLPFIEWDDEKHLITKKEIIELNLKAIKQNLKDLSEYVDTKLKNLN